jgi:hypothetical protein
MFLKCIGQKYSILLFIPNTPLTFPMITSDSLLKVLILHLAMEPRQVTRHECARFAREAYNLGVRIIGGNS